MIFTQPPKTLTLDFGSTSLPGARGEASHLIPRCRLAGIEAFSRWKKDGKSHLDLFEESVANSMGRECARLIVSAMNECGRNRIQILKVILEDRDDIILPPKISYLVKKTLEQAEKVNKGRETLHSMMKDFTGIFESEGLVDITADIILGDVRTHSISCCELDSGWERTMVVYDPAAIVYELLLHNAPYSVADHDAYQDVRNRVSSHALDKGASGLERLLGLASGVIMDEGTDPDLGEAKQIVEELRDCRKRFSEPGFFCKSEFLVPIGIRCRGSFGLGPITYPDDIA